MNWWAPPSSFKDHVHQIHLYFQEIRIAKSSFETPFLSSSWYSQNPLNSIYSVLRCTKCHCRCRWSEHGWWIKQKGSRLISPNKFQCLVVQALLYRMRIFEKLLLKKWLNGFFFEIFFNWKYDGTVTSLRCKPIIVIFWWKQKCADKFYKVLASKWCQSPNYQWRWKIGFSNSHRKFPIQYTWIAFRFLMHAWIEKRGTTLWGAHIREHYTVLRILKEHENHAYANISDV
jgi:hypothetical protein